LHLTNQTELPGSETDWTSRTRCTMETNRLGQGRKKKLGQPHIGGRSGKLRPIPPRPGHHRQVEHWDKPDRGSTKLFRGKLSQNGRQLRRVRRRRLTHRADRGRIEAGHGNRAAAGSRPSRSRPVMGTGRRQTPARAGEDRGWARLRPTGEETDDGREKGGRRRIRRKKIGSR
jgi:hypothetical protein